MYAGPGLLAVNSIYLISLNIISTTEFKEEVHHLGG